MPSYEGEGVLFWLVTSDLKLVKWWVIKKKHYNWVADILCGHKWTPAVMVKAKRINSISHHLYFTAISQQEQTACWPGVSKSPIHFIKRNVQKKRWWAVGTALLSSATHKTAVVRCLKKKRKQEKPTKIEKWSLFAGLNALNVLLKVQICNYTFIAHFWPLWI